MVIWYSTTIEFNNNYEIGKNSINKKIIMILAYIAVKYEDIDKEQV